MPRRSARLLKNQTKSNNKSISNSNRSTKPKSNSNRSRPSKSKSNSNRPSKSKSNSNRSTKSKSKRSNNNNNQSKYKWKENMWVAPSSMPASQHYVLKKNLQDPKNLTWVAKHKSGRYFDIISKSVETDGSWVVRQM